MRSVPAGSFERLSSLEALWRAFRACRSGKGRQPVMAAFDVDADRHICGLHRRLRDGSYRPDPWRSRVVHDPKTRLIAAPTVRDRIVHRALVDQIGPTFERSFSTAHYATGRGRGAHRAVLRFLGAMRAHRFRVKLDVRRYFLTVDRRLLIDLLAARIRASDRSTVELLETLIAASGSIYDTSLARRVLGLDKNPLPPGCGIGLGSYLSQWCGAFYLDGLDQFVQRELRPGCYIRYMDDLALLDDDAARLEAARDAIRDWLHRHRSLRLKDRGTQVVSTAQSCVFLGYRVSRSGLSPSRKLRRRFEERMRQAAARGPESFERTLVAYRGLLLF